MVWAAEQGASGDKINSVRQSMQVPIHDAYKNDDISNYPFQDLAAVYHEKKEKGILTPAEIEAIEKAPAGDPCNRLAVLLAARCGLRAGEVRGLQWGDIADGIITVPWGGSRGLRTLKYRLWPGTPMGA
jgi:integrase